MKILAIDDDEIILDLVSHLLRQEGHEVCVARNGREGLEILQQENCQLVILDWEMPGISGPEICRTIRCGDYGRYIYVIMLTSRSAPQELVEGMEAGADDFVGKPFNRTELKMRVAAGLRVVSLETRDALIFTLAKLAESRDADTGHHLERVQRYTRTLAQCLSRHSRYETAIDGAFIRNLYLTSPLHDIGKVGIPDSILLKPGKLTRAEFEIMQRHTTLGAQTLLETLERFPNVKYLRMAWEIARSHHERWDGTGYPEKLAGEEIPLAARIVAVADVYDALTTRRVYKDAYTHEVAVAMIVDGSGSHFDPEIVEAFLECVGTFSDIREQFSERAEDSSVESLALAR